MSFLAEDGAAAPALASASCLVAGGAPAEVLVWDKAALRRLLAEAAPIALALQGSLAVAVVAKLHSKVHDRDTRELAHYREILEAVLCDGVVHPSEKRMLRLYRERHLIERREHDLMVVGLGWNVAEYEDGAHAVVLGAPRHARP